MSMRALLLAFREHLRGTASGGLGLKPEQCEIRVDGRPPAFPGEVFLAIHEGNWTTNDIEGLDETLGVDITLTLRYPKMPDDREWRLLVGSTDTADIAARNCMYAWVERIRAALHLDVGSDRILNLANTHIPGFASTVNGFVEPPRIRSVGRIQRQGPGWFHSEQSGPEVSGISRTITTDGARRVQRIESMT